MEEIFRLEDGKMRLNFAKEKFLEKVDEFKQESLKTGKFPQGLLIPVPANFESKLFVLIN
jgi:hypothetical protein